MSFIPGVKEIFHANVLPNTLHNLYIEKPFKCYHFSLPTKFALKLFSIYDIPVNFHPQLQILNINKIHNTSASAIQNFY
jgi:hypothetical protein